MREGIGVDGNQGFEREVDDRFEGIRGGCWTGLTVALDELVLCA